MRSSVSFGFDAVERPVPTLVYASVVAGFDRGTVDRIGSAIAAGADGVLLDLRALFHPDTLAFVAAVRDLVGPAVHLIVADDPSLAVDAGTGLLLPEAGIATAESRRRLGSEPLLGRVVSSTAAAEASAGVDFVVADPIFAESSVAALGLDGLRAIVERSWAPVLARGEMASSAVAVARATAAMATGAQGIVVDSSTISGDDLTPTLQALRNAIGLADSPIPASANFAVSIEVDGEPTSLEPMTAVSDLLNDRAYPSGSVVRLNGQRLPRHAHDETVLRDGDRVEIRR